MMNMNLAELTAAELRELMRRADVIRANKVGAGFKQIAKTLKEDGSEDPWMDDDVAAMITGMNTRQLTNWQNYHNYVIECGLTRRGQRVTKHYICEEDGSRLTVTKYRSGFSLR